MGRGLLRRWTTWLVIACATGAAAGRAAGQGQSFPPPISTESLERSLGRYAKPAPEARAAIERAHDEYLEAFRRLQDAELESFSRERPPMLTGGDMGAWMRRFVSLRGRIIGLDTTLFESIRQALPEAQRGGVDRIRWVREAEVLRSGFLGDMTGGVGGPSRARLSDLVYSAGLSDADMARLDPILRDYEQRHLAVVRKSVDETERLFTEFGEKLKKEGLWGPVFEEAQKDPERAMELWRRMSGLVKETFTAVFVESALVGESTRKGYVQVRDAISPEGRMKFVPAWLQSAYPGVSARYPRSLVADAQRAKRLAGEGTATAQAIDRILDETMSRAMAAIDAACKAEDGFQQEMMLTQFSMMEEGAAESRDALMERQQQERQRLTEQIERAVSSGADAIRAQLPPEAVEKLGQPDPAPGTADATAVVAAAPPIDATVEAVAEADAGALEIAGFDAPPVTVDMVANQLRPYPVASLQRFLTSIGATEEQRTMLAALHGDYLARHTETIVPKRTAYDESRMSLYEPQEDGAMALDSAKAERSAALLRDLAAATRALDEEFFATMGATLGAAHADAVRVERLGRVTGSIGCVGQQMWVYSPNAEQAADLVATVRGANLADGERAAALAALAAHADAIESAAVRALDAMIDSQLRMERLQGELFRARHNQEEQTRAAMEWQKRSGEIMQPAKAAADARRAANLAAIEAVSQALSEPSRNALQRGWSHASYPTVFKDPKSLFATFQKAETLPDLAPQQGEQLKAALEEYKAAYEVACDAMLAASLKSIPDSKDGQMGADYWMAIQERERSIARMRFERDETSARAASKLRQILTPAQLAQFPILADPSKTTSTGERRW